MSFENSLVTSWLEIFGSDPVHPRTIVEMLDGDDPIKTHLLNVVPLLTVYPNPKVLGRWLADNENRPFINGNDAYRFSRVGHKWKLVPALRVDVA